MTVAEFKELSDAAEMLWVVLANVSGSDWTKQTLEWQESAAKWRDNYFSVIRNGSTESETSIGRSTT